MNVTIIQNCHTVYPGRNSLSKSSLAVLISANVLLTFMNIIVNSFLIFALSVTKQLKSISNTLILYLSLSDIFVGLLVQNPVTVLLAKFKTQTNCPLELTGQFTSYIFPQISGVMIMIIAIDRWLHMKFLNRYSTLMNMRRAHFMVIANILLAFFIATASILASLYKKFFVFNAILVVTDVTVVIVIYIAYVSTFRSVRLHMASIRKRNKEQQNNISANIGKDKFKKKPRKYDSKLAKTMVFILTSLTVCYMPYFIVGLYWSYLRYYKNVITGQLIDTVLWFSFILVYINSTLNAIIFIKRNKKVFGYLKKLLGCTAGVETTLASTDNSSTTQKQQTSI